MKKEINSVKEFFDLLSKDHIEAIRNNSVPDIPILFMLKDKKVIAMAFEGDPMGELKQIIMKTDPEAYLFCAFGWALKFDKKEDADEFSKGYHKGDVASNPDKVEMLVMHGVSRDGKSSLKQVYTVQRDSNEKVTKLDKMDADEIITTKLP